MTEDELIDQIGDLFESMRDLCGDGRDDDLCLVDAAYGAGVMLVVLKLHPEYVAALARWSEPEAIEVPIIEAWVRANPLEVAT